MRSLLLASATALCRVPHLARTPDKLIQRHATPIRACISPDLGVSQPSLVLFECCPKTAPLLASGSSKARPRRIRLLNSSALRAKPISLPPFLQRETRQINYIIVIHTCSLRLRADWSEKLLLQQRPYTIVNFSFIEGLHLGKGASHMDYQRIAELSLSGEVIDKDQALGMLSCPDDELLPLLHAAYKVRHAFFGNRVQIQILTNAKSGSCTEDCHYCAQSRISSAKIDKHPLLAVEDLVDGARRAKKYNVKRYCTALSGIRSNDKDIDTLCQAFSRIRDEVRIETCCSIGLLKKSRPEG